MTDDLPTARNTLPKDAWLCLFVWCKACFHRGSANLQAIIEAGPVDEPLKDLPLREMRQPTDRQRDDGQGRERRAAMAR